MLTHEAIAAQLPAEKMGELMPKVVDSAAVKHALDARCSESEESSDDSCSSDGGSVDDDGEEVDLSVSMSPAAAPRRPTSLSTNSFSDRRASAPSKRSPLSISSSRSLSTYTCPVPSPRTPSVSMRHDAALRSFQQRRDLESESRVQKMKARPAMVDIGSIPKAATPQIEIVQVYDDEEEEAKRDEDSAKADRSAARKRMMSTLGRGQAKAGGGEGGQRKESRRVPSLDQISNLFHNRAGEEAKTPTPKTPGTASPFHHQRNVSCPTPTSPYMQEYGEVQVIITPPTPRPQGPGSPTVGVQLSGFQRGNSCHGHARSYSSDDASLLAPPPFELAPGKHKVMEQQQMNAMAWFASWQIQQEQMSQIHHQQQQLLLASMQHALPNCFDLMAMGMPNPFASNATVESPTIVPGTPGAPSMIHVQQQKAILAQKQQFQKQYSGHKATTPAETSSPASSSPPSKSSSASAKSSWWRSNPESGTGSDDSASSCSVYSKSSGAYSSGFSGAAADSAEWRRRETPEVQSPERIRSAGPLYLPPGKRAALLQKQQQQRQS